MVGEWSDTRSSTNEKKRNDNLISGRCPLPDVSGFRRQKKRESGRASVQLEAKRGADLTPRTPPHLPPRCREQGKVWGGREMLKHM